LKIDLLCP